jgi:hypothetical protein
MINGGQGTNECNTDTKDFVQAMIKRQGQCWTVDIQSRISASDDEILDSGADKTGLTASARVLHDLEKSMGAPALKQNHTEAKLSMLQASGSVWHFRPQTTDGTRSNLAL